MSTLKQSHSAEKCKRGYVKAFGLFETPVCCKIAKKIEQWGNKIEQNCNKGGPLGDKKNRKKVSAPTKLSEMTH